MHQATVSLAATNDTATSIIDRATATSSFRQLPKRCGALATWLSKVLLLLLLLLLCCRRRYGLTTWLFVAEEVALLVVAGRDCFAALVCVLAPFFSCFLCGFASWRPACPPVCPVPSRVLPPSSFLLPPSSFLLPPRPTLRTLFIAGTPTARLARPPTPLSVREPRAQPPCRT